jgi:two-component system, OmpR family, sensor histidine kinase KdpD
MLKSIQVGLVFKNQPGNTEQHLYSVACILFVSAVCYAFFPISGYHSVALILLAAVSIIAMFFEITPVITAAILSALIWNYFFIPPRFTFQIGSGEDILMFLMYFIIALLNTVLTIKKRQFERKAQEKEGEENLVKLYNTLLNSLANGLRKPIAEIKSATDNLQNKKQLLDEQKKAELISEISEASLRLNRHVENLLNTSRLESGTLKINGDFCDINRLFYAVISQFKESECHHKIEIIMPESLPFFKIDFGLMEQVLLNLVHNAVNYSPAESTITLSAEYVSGKLVIRVEDEGEGFAKDQIDKAFDRFYRLNNPGTGSTGLGLSIVKGFVEAHQGNVALENIRGGGARFTIAIPAITSYVNTLINE